MAIRDLTEASFRAALSRRGFTKTSLGFTHHDAPNATYGGVYLSKPFRLHRRATLSRIIKAHDRQMRALRTNDRGVQA